MRPMPPPLLDAPEIDYPAFPIIVVLCAIFFVAVVFA